MSLISEKDAEFLRGDFEEKLTSPVKLVMFTQEMECQFCAETRQIAEEIAGLSDSISVEVHDFVGESELAASLGIDKIPAIAVQGAQDHGIRFYGIPAGYEFASLLEAIKDVAAGDSGLPAEILSDLAKVDKPVRMQVMVTPT